MSRVLPYLNHPATACLFLTGFIWLSVASLNHAHQKELRQVSELAGRDDSFVAARPGRADAIGYTRTSGKGGEVKLYRPKTESERLKVIAQLWNLENGNYDIGSLK